jgi:hypothetical protein
LVIQSFFKACAVFDSRTSNENISSKLEYADCTEYADEYTLILINLLSQS